VKKGAILSVLVLLAAEGASAEGVGRRLPAEKRQLADPVTGRSDRGASGPQAFVVHERTGDIVQLLHRMNFAS
jgi:hypothetical protein